MNSESTEKPAIELYMYSLNQEFPVGKGHQSFLERHSALKQDISGALAQIESVESQVYRTGRTVKTLPADWSAQWLENQWIQNHTKAAGVGIVDNRNLLNRLLIREEDFGGIVFDPQSDRVYKVNKQGLKLLNALRSPETPEKMVDDISGKLSLSPDLVYEFITQLQVAGLWN